MAAVVLTCGIASGGKARIEIGSDAIDTCAQQRDTLGQRINHTLQRSEQPEPATAHIPNRHQTLVMTTSGTWS